MALMPGWDTALLQAAKSSTSFFLNVLKHVEPTPGHTRHHIIKNYEWKQVNSEEELLKDFKDYKDPTIEVGARMPFFFI
jgi:hypothetical protein